MGIGTSGESKETLLDRLQFIQTAQDEHFGRVEIFKFKEPPYEYMMKYTKMFREHDDQFTSACELLQGLKLKTHKNLVKMPFIEEK
jgi:hypothetical protein